MVAVGRRPPPWSVGHCLASFIFIYLLTNKTLFLTGDIDHDWPDRQCADRYSPAKYVVTSGRR